MQPYGYDRDALPLLSSAFLLTPSKMIPFFSISASSRRDSAFGLPALLILVLLTDHDLRKQKTDSEL